MGGDARAAGRARWSDARLWLGVGLLVISMVAGAALLSRGTESVIVLRATRDLSAGSSALDVEPVAVPPAVAEAGYATSADLAVAGQVLRWPVPEGQLVPVAALGTAERDDRRLVTVPLDPLRAPVGLAAGDVVDVWSTPKSSVDTIAAVPALVLSAVTVSNVAVSASAMSGDLSVVVDVGASDVEALVTAARSGVIDVVAVPVSAQGVR